MKNRICRSILASGLCLLMACSILAVPASAVTQEQVNAMAARREELTAQRLAQQAVIDELEEKQAGILEKKYAMDERNQYNIQQLQLNNEEIALYDEMIAEKNKELQKAIRREEKQLERYRARVRAMEENGNLGYLALLLNSSDLGELLTVMDDVGEIMESDRELEEEYIAARENTEEIKADYENTKTELEAKQEELRAEQKELEAQIEEAYQMLAEIEADIANNVEAYNALVAAEAEAYTAFNQLAAQLEAQRQAAQQGGSSGGSSIQGTGQFIWPVGADSITSDFGNRVHPVYGTDKFHSGVDIGAADGANIGAADAGTVVYSGVMGGYGNCVMIDHGNGYTTLYAHMSSISMSKGDTVSQGDLVGQVGSTGVATGPHLHYEVRQNGSTIDPMDFY